MTRISTSMGITGIGTSVIGTTGMGITSIGTTGMGTTSMGTTGIGTTSIGGTRPLLPILNLTLNEAKIPPTSTSTDESLLKVQLYTYECMSVFVYIYMNKCILSLCNYISNMNI
jgi:hypothetical protein